MKAPVFSPIKCVAQGQRNRRMLRRAVENEKASAAGAAQRGPCGRGQLTDFERSIRGFTSRSAARPEDSLLVDPLPRAGLGGAGCG